MEINKILHADYLDLIFDNRNKDYGSYELRKHYNSRILKALGVMVSIVALAVAIPVAIGKFFPDKVAVTLIDHTPSTIILDQIRYETKPQPKIKSIQPVQHTNASIAKTVALPPPKIVHDADVPTKVDPPKITATDVAGLVNNAGNGGINVATTSVTPSGPPIAGELKGEPKTGTTISSEAPIAAPDVMPEYPGGMAALQKYLQANLKYPNEARENHVEGRVIIKFVVNESGKIENAVVVRGIGAGCDKEALRVVNAMKAWKPGMIHGKAVKVYYTLPIAFRLGDN